MVGGFGSGALVFAPTINFLMAKFATAPVLLGAPLTPSLLHLSPPLCRSIPPPSHTYPYPPGQGVEVVTEGGRQFCQLGDQLQEVVFATGGELARVAPGLVEGYYLVGSGRWVQD